MDIELNENTLDGITGGVDMPWITEEEKQHIYEKCNGDELKAIEIMHQIQKQRQDEYIRENNSLTSLENNKFSK